MFDDINDPFADYKLYNENEENSEETADSFSLIRFDPVAEDELVC